ncbi:MAG TPA: DUF2127 domain-containing protein [Solirubrobacteraceae bacterium]|nr:DUF2127 domain-containing protein [Solirubrobacteraceae bacterium]
MRRKINWELVTCGVRGHVLVGTDARMLRDEHASFARELAGLRWHRCLRCDTWTPVPPPADPAREHPPDRLEIQIPERGKALRDKIVLRVIAVDRVIHFVVLGLLGIAVLFVARHETSLRGDFYRVVADLQRGVGGGPVQNTPQHGVLHELAKLFALRAGALTRAGLIILAYGILEGVEAVGLWFAKRWAEYLTLVATTILLPLEVYELINGATALKVIGFIINLAIVIYLLFAKRLFGLRGGGKAELAERAAEMSWEHIERTSPPEPAPVG